MAASLARNRCRKGLVGGDPRGPFRQGRSKIKAVVDRLIKVEGYRLGGRGLACRRLQLGPPRLRPFDDQQVWRRQRPFEKQRSCRFRSVLFHFSATLASMTTVMRRHGRSHAADRQARKAFEPTDEAADFAEPPGGSFAVEADRPCESAAGLLFHRGAAGGGTTA